MRLSDIYLDCLQRGRKACIEKEFATLKTSFYLLNRGIRKRGFIKQIIEFLDRQSYVQEITLDLLLERFCGFAKSRLISSFWISRKKGNLAPKAEIIAQGHLSSFLAGHFKETAFIDRELASGIGYVDISVTYNNIRHLLELKVIRQGEVFGIGQLYQYMQTEAVKDGYLIVFDARKLKGERIPKNKKISDQIIKVWAVNINPSLPSQKKIVKSFS